MPKFGILFCDRTTSAIFTPMENILILGVFEAWVLSVLIFLKKKRGKADLFLALFFFVYGLNIFLAYIENYNKLNGYPYPDFINVTAPLILLHGPLLWLYVLHQTSPPNKIRANYLLHLIPFLIMIADHSINYYFKSAPERIEIAQSEVFTQYWSYPFLVFMIAVSPAFYFSLGIRKINRYNREIRNQLSKVEVYDFNWLKMILYIALIVYGLINLSFVIDIFLPLASFKLLQVIAFGIAAALLLVLGFFGRKQSNLFNSPLIENAIEYNESPGVEFKNPEDEAFIRELEIFMVNTKPYLDPELTISQLSKQLSVNHTYISNLLNRYLNKNFFDYINSYRVEEFKEEALKEENFKFTLLAIAYKCGFNSKATFNRVSKNVTGTTPGHYRKGLVEK